MAESTGTTRQEAETSGQVCGCAGGQVFTDQLCFFVAPDRPLRIVDREQLAAEARYDDPPARPKRRRGRRVNLVTVEHAFLIALTSRARGAV